MHFAVRSWRSTVESPRHEVGQSVVVPQEMCLSHLDSRPLRQNGIDVSTRPHGPGSHAAAFPCPPDDLVTPSNLMIQ